jgi:hypothetical protein
MPQPYKQRVNKEPRLTYSALARLLAPNSSVAIERIVKENKYPPTAQVISYVDCAKALADLATGGPRRPLGLEPHEAEVLKLFQSAPLKLPPKVSAKLPPAATTSRKWPIEGVDVSFVPDLLLTGPRGTGALKFHCAKAPLPTGVGPKTAALLYVHLRDFQKDAAAVPEYCLVYDVRSRKLHRPGASPDKVMEHARSACRLTASLWNGL